MCGDRHKKQESASWFVDECARLGIKATHQRREIYEELSRTQAHPDADTIYKGVKERIPAISHDTVYRNLKVLEEHGVIQKVGAIGYRTRFDANMTPHHHFVCTRCGLIRDFYDERFNEYQPSSDVLEMGKVDGLRVELRGVCKQCSSGAG